MSEEEIMVNHYKKYISIPQSWFNNYGLGHLHPNLYKLYSTKGYSIQLNIF